MRKQRIPDAFFADTHDIYRQRSLLQRLQSESMVCRSALCVTRNALIQTHASRPSSQHRDTRKVQTRGQQLSMNRFKTSKFKNTTPKIPKKDVSRGAARRGNACGAIECLVFWTPRWRSGADALISSNFLHPQLNICEASCTVICTITRH